MRHLRREKVKATKSLCRTLKKKSKFTRDRDSHNDFSLDRERERENTIPPRGLSLHYGLLAAAPTTAVFLLLISTPPPVCLYIPIYIQRRLCTFVRDRTRASCRLGCIVYIRYMHYTREKERSSLRWFVALRIASAFFGRYTPVLIVSRSDKFPTDELQLARVRSSLSLSLYNILSKLRIIKERISSWNSSESSFFFHVYYTLRTALRYAMKLLISLIIVV